MKRNTLTLIFLLSAFTIAGQSFYHDNAIRYKGISEEKKYSLFKKEKTPDCNIRIDFFYPERYADLFILEKIQSLFIAECFGDDYAAHEPKDAARKYVKDYIARHQEFSDGNEIFSEDASFHSYEHNIRNTILFNRGGLITMVINSYEYTGGAHGLSSRRGVMIDLQTGNRITYDDVFSPLDKQAIADLILQNLLKDNHASTLEQLYELGYYFDEITPTENYIAHEEGITFIYPQYELGAYVLGIVEVMIPYYQIHTYIRPESPVMKFIKR